jgi:hypothetical protein
MRAIILLQSIIIILGAYYIYTMTHAVKVEESPVPVVDMVPTTEPTDTHPGYVPPKANPPSDEPVSSTTLKSTVTGPNDAGMEYPDAPPPDKTLRTQ